MTELAQRRLRVRPGLAFVAVLRPALYVLLVASAFLTFWAGGDIAGFTLPDWVRGAAPAVFLLFVAVFAVYRFALVRARKYPAMTALFQVGLSALIWVLLLPSTRQKIVPRHIIDDVPALFSSADPRVRALAAEVAGYRPDGVKYVEGLIERLNDADARVRERARSSLQRLAGLDAAPGEEGKPAVEKWRALARQRGWVQ
ncbi:MAG TPA: HEAT repeat domain-containing protein [Myxococcales bacterium]|nr:HEAT repeat domain-containing protein [Myxococcales bacterium]